MLKQLQASGLNAQINLNNDKEQKKQESATESSPRLEIQVEETGVESKNKKVQNKEQHFKNLNEYQANEKTITKLIYKYKRKPECNCPQILLVDDEEFNLSAQNFLIQELGYKKPDLARNGGIAVNMVLEQNKKSCQCRYKVIVMDIFMPVMNGYDACKEIQRLISNGTIYYVNLIAVSANVTEKISNYSLQVGFKKFLPKPISRKDLKETLELYLPTTE